LGSYYNRHDRHAEAVVQYKKVIELTPDNAQAYSNMAAAYLDMGDPKVLPQAEAALKKSLELGPSYPAYANLGNLYLNEARYADAAEMAEKALQLNDKDYRIWSNLLVAREWQKQGDKAADARKHMRELLEKLTRAQPQDAEAQSLLAICYAEENLREKALQGIGKALALAPDDGRVLVDAGEVYQDLGDRGRALHYLQESLKKGTTMDDLKTRPTLQEILADASLRNNGK
jgi:serine/threonine-protein kinase